MTKYFFFRFCCAALCLCPSLLCGQVLEPLYKFTLHFEDAVGNKDSVIMGFDSLAFPLLDPEFGEVDITNQPFDFVFEVRGAALSSEDFHSKIVVDAHFQWMCQESFANYQMISMRAKHFPVLMTWDSTYFYQECLQSSLITRSFGFALTPDFFDPKLTSLSETSSLLITRTYLEYTDEQWFTTNVFDIENGERDTTYNFFIGISSRYPSSSTGEVSDIAVRLFPNPTLQTLTVKVPDTNGEDLWLSLCDVHGRVVLRQKLSAHQETLLDVGGLLPGVYAACAFDQEGRRRFTDRIVKQP